MTAKLLPFTPPDDEARPVDINVLTATDIRKRDWRRVHTEADRNPPIVTGGRKWGWS